VIRVEELLRAGAFVCLVGAVFVMAALTVVRLLAARTRGEPRRPTHIEGGCVALAVLGVACVAWGAVVEPYWLEVVEVRLPSRKLVAGTAPLRIVQISDLHCDPVVRLEDELPDRVLALRPDLVCFTGDAANSAEGIPVFKACIARIAESVPTYVIGGNWEAWHFPDVDRFDGTGVTELKGALARLDVRGTPVQIVGSGMDDPGGIGRALRTADPLPFTVALFHPPYPEVVSPSDRGTVDLMLSGHVHGGQVALPFYGALVTLSQHGKEYERGLYDLGGMHLYVNRGIGMEGGAAPRVRFASRPEVTLFVIHPAGGAEVE